MPDGGVAIGGDIDEQETLNGYRKYRPRTAGPGPRMDSADPDCPYERSRTEIPGAATENLYRKHAPWLFRARLHRHTRIRASVHRSGRPSETDYNVRVVISHQNDRVPNQMRERAML